MFVCVCFVLFVLIGSLRYENVLLFFFIGSVIVLCLSFNVPSYLIHRVRNSINPLLRRQ